MAVEKDLFSVKLDFLTHDLDRIEGDIQRLGTLSFTVRGWAITVVSAMIAYAYVNKDSIAAFAAILPATLFWASEALVLKLMLGCILRREEIEDYLSSDTFCLDFVERRPPTLRTPSLSLYDRQRPFIIKLLGVTSAGLKWSISVVYAALIVAACLSGYLILEGF